MELPPVIPEPQAPQIYEEVTFRHPYNNFVSLKLPRVDTIRDPESGAKSSVLLKTTALAACCIIARNCPGFFVLERDRSAAVRVEAEFLDCSDLFYHLNDPHASLDYPVWSQFREWEFPHVGFPEDWKALSKSRSVTTMQVTRSDASKFAKYRDKYCCTTKYTAGLNSCRLIPKNGYVAILNPCNDGKLTRFGAVRRQSHGCIRQLSSTRNGRSR